MNDKKLYERDIKTVNINIYERDPVARQKCVEHFDAICQVRNYDFEKMFDPIDYYTQLYIRIFVSCDY